MYPETVGLVCARARVMTGIPYGRLAQAPPCGRFHLSIAGLLQRAQEFDHLHGKRWRRLGWLRCTMRCNAMRCDAMRCDGGAAMLQAVVLRGTVEAARIERQSEGRE